MNRLFILLTIFFLISCGSNQETIHPKVESISESVYASGTITTSDAYQVFPSAAGVIEKVFVKDQNEICYFTEIDTLNLFIKHLIYQKSPWTFKGKHEWSEYYNNIHLFIHDRMLKNNQKAKNGINEIKQVYLIKWSELYNNSDKIIQINNKKYKLRHNLNRYIEDKVILDILNKNI